MGSLCGIQGQVGRTFLGRAKSGRLASSLSQCKRLLTPFSQQTARLSTAEVESPAFPTMRSSLSPSAESHGTLSGDFLASVVTNEERGLPEIIETQNVPVRSWCPQVNLLTNRSPWALVASEHRRRHALISIADVPHQILLYAKRSEVESEAIQQLVALAESPLPVGYVAAMPDVHVGKGVTVRTPHREYRPGSSVHVLESHVSFSI